MTIRRQAATLSRCFALLALIAPRLLLAETTGSVRPLLRGLTPVEQARLAEQFAPVLVFHPSEQYFPTNPLFQLKDGQSWKSLGTPDSRNEIYQNLSLPEKAKLATVYYRAYPAWNSNEPVIILEYSLYYVHND